MSYKITLNNASNYAEFKQNKEMIELTLKEAVAYLGSINAANDTITTRSVTILGIIIASTITLITYGLSGGFTGSPDPIKISALFLAARLYFIAWCLSENVKTQTTSPLGDEPDSMVNPDTCSMSVEDLNIIRIQEHQVRIKLAKKSNKEQSSNLNEAIHRLLNAPWWTLVIFLLVGFGLFAYSLMAA